MKDYESLDDAGLVIVDAKDLKDVLTFVDNNISWPNSVWFARSRLIKAVEDSDYRRPSTAGKEN